jgi:hypothetical protein
MVESERDRAAMLADFGVVVALKRSGKLRKSVKGIFDSAYTEIDVSGSVGFTSTTPRFVCRSCDIVGAEDADSVTVDGTIYLIRVVQPDGTGMTELILEKQ